MTRSIVVLAAVEVILSWKVYTAGNGDNYTGSLVN